MNVGAIVELKEDSKLPPVGECIYCGSAGPLSDEHIVPYGLGGTLILPDASCNKCAWVTRSFERTVLRGFMLEGRTIGKIRTRRPKERPTSFPITVVDERGSRTVTVPVADFPAFLFLPVMPPAGFLVGREAERGTEVCGTEVIAFGKPLRNFARDRGAPEVSKTATVNPHAFARMLAKIGYGFALAVQGIIPRAEVPVLPLILGTADDANRWIGSATFETRPAQRNLRHTLDLNMCSVTPPDGPTEQVSVARIKLFASAGIAKGYDVVVRRRAAPSTD
jgi:hypothetical protein